MKYTIVNEKGIVEVRQNSDAEIPNGGIALNDSEYSGLLNGTLMLDGNEVVVNPNPPSVL